MLKLISKYLIICVGVFAMIQGADQEVQVKSGYLELSNSKIWYQKFYTAASQDQVPMICLHGGPGGTLDWFIPLKGLAQSRPLIIYDQSGCGNSITNDPQFNGWTLEYYLQELQELITALGYDQVYLLGHSWGAMLAAKHVINGDPRVAKLILVGPCLSAPMWTAACRRLADSLPGKVGEIMLQHESDGTTNAPEYQVAVNEFYQNFFCRMRPWTQVLTGRMNHQIYQQMWGSYEMTATGNLKDVDLVPELHQIKVPTLILCGDYDMATAEDMQVCAEQIEDVELIVVKDCAHCMMFEQPEQLMQAVRSFLE